MRVKRIVLQRDTPLMLSRHSGFEIAVVIVVCALAIFSVPALQGACLVSHGPVTALRSARAGRKLLLAMARTAFFRLDYRFSRLFRFFAEVAWESSARPGPILSALAPVFRC
jgi:hypothetical protein